MTEEELIVWIVAGFGTLLALYYLWVGIVKPTLAFLDKHGDKIKVFFIIWVVVILINQIFIFGACFAPYCLAAALPHTSVISAVITYFYFKSNQTDSIQD